jgi:hypothetical protein
MRERKSFPEQWKEWQDKFLTFFFTDETTGEGKKIARLQYKACWVGIAMLLQFFNEALRVSIQAIESKYHDTVTLLDPISNILLVLSILGSFVALWMAFRPETKGDTSTTQRKYPQRWQRWICGLCLLLACIGVGASAVSIARCFLPVEFANDGTVLDTNAAMTLIHGRNPYASSSLENLKHVKIHPEWTTPLRRGHFAGKLEYPSTKEMATALDSGNAQEFETKVSYPALSFISLIPFAIFNNFNVLPLYIFFHLLLIIAAWKYAIPELRPWVLLLAFANVSMWTATVGETLDMFYTSLLTLAWLTSHRRWWSVLLLGLAIASKQTVWFFVPFYGIMVYWQSSFKEALSRVILALGIGLMINLPFILWGPGDWLAGVMAPLADPMFPLGTGLIALSTGHLIPYLPEKIYQLLEYTAYVLALLYYWFHCRKAPEAAMLLAIVFLFFAWRSLPSYFYCSPFPLLALMLKKTLDSHSEQNSDHELLLNEKKGARICARTPG